MCPIRKAVMPKEKELEAVTQKQEGNKFGSEAFVQVLAGAFVCLGTFAGLAFIYFSRYFCVLVYFVRLDT